MTKFDSEGETGLYFPFFLCFLFWGKQAVMSTLFHYTLILEAMVWHFIGSLALDCDREGQSCSHSAVRYN